MMIEVCGVSFGYSKNTIILKNLSAYVKKGDIVSILGANGCGKSTFLKIMLGIIKPLKGEVKVCGHDIFQIGRRQVSSYLSYVPQAHNAMFPYLAEDVVLMGRCRGSLWRSYSKKDYEMAGEALAALKIYHLKDKVYSALSGGEQQLCLVARAMAQGSDFCFMDEPVSSLDYGNQYRLLDAVKSLSEKGVTFVITTHHPDHALYLGGRAVLMKDGGIFRDGRAEDIINKDSLYALYNVKTDDMGKVYGVD